VVLLCHIKGIWSCFVHVCSLSLLKVLYQNFYFDSSWNLVQAATSTYTDLVREGLIWPFIQPFFFLTYYFGFLILIQYFTWCFIRFVLTLNKHAWSSLFVFESWMDMWISRKTRIDLWNFLVSWEGRREWIAWSSRRPNLTVCLLTIVPLKAPPSQTRQCERDTVFFLIFTDGTANRVQRQHESSDNIGRNEN
jgi:uncharacterized membrane protein (DUF485 family)